MVELGTNGEADDAESLNERQHLGEGRLAAVPHFLQRPHRLLNLVILEKRENDALVSGVSCADAETKEM